MPRFSDAEKERIQAKLLAEGERLFATYGLRKVTIDEIVSAVSIAKATFYTFYAGKELLYLDIVQGVQLKIFTELDTLLETNANLDNKQRVKQVFAVMYTQMQKYPILARMDSSTAELISRKVGASRLAAFSKQNLDAALVLVKHGIKFTCSPQVASAAFRAVYHGWLSLQSTENDLQEAAADILLNGVIEQMITE